MWVSGFRDESDMSDLTGNVGGRGFRKRCELTEGNRVTCLMGHLFLPFFLQPKALIPLVPMDITFTLSKPAFAIRSKSEHTNYRFNFRKFTIKVPRMRVAPSIASRLEQRLAREAVRYPLRNISTRLFTIPAGLRK